MAASFLGVMLYATYLSGRYVYTRANPPRQAKADMFQDDCSFPAAPPQETLHKDFQIRRLKLGFKLKILMQSLPGEGALNAGLPVRETLRLGVEALDVIFRVCEQGLDQLSLLIV